MDYSARIGTMFSNANKWKSQFDVKEIFQTEPQPSSPVAFIFLGCFRASQTPLSFFDFSRKIRIFAFRVIQISINKILSGLYSSHLTIYASFHDRIERLKENNNMRIISWEISSGIASMSHHRCHTVSRRLHPVDPGEHIKYHLLFFSTRNFANVLANLIN